ncbi:DUF563 domain containing protein [Nitzschia inconspicua]|uniref:DUF563 domain containing protein n=1 Tax=Nitzschia inconspicua TaxID=303405 RepID=A0A9K3PUS0_9STRA|nr:DUF563 domain containing protein [Nitzschia inconspicua]
MQITRRSTTFREEHLLQSSIGMRPWWRRQQPPKFLWHPKVVWLSNETFSPFHATRVDYFPENSVIIPLSVAEPPHGGTTLTLLMDTLLPVHKLVDLFGFGGNRTVFLHILNCRNNTLHDEECNSDFRAKLEQGLRWMGYHTWEPPKHNNAELICAPVAASGMGQLTASGLSQRGHKIQDYTHLFHHNAGLGNTFWKFRNHILSNLKPFETLNPAAMKVVLAVNSTDHPNIAQALYNRFHHSHNYSAPDDAKPTIEIMDNIVADDLETLIQMAANAQFWIANSQDDDWTWPSLFLPRNASLILLYNETLLIQKRNGNQASPIRKDFGLWNHLSHVKSHWLSLQHNTSTIVKIISRLIHTDASKRAKTNGERTIQKKSGMSFFGFDVYPDSARSLSSDVHCIGENWQWDSQNYRSCRHELLCFNASSQGFVAPEGDEAAHNLLRPHDLLSTDTFGKSVMRGENVRLGNGQPWLPTRTLSNDDNVYMLPNDVVLIPIKANLVNMNNPGHLLWDIWLPIFNLIQLYGNEYGKILLGLDHEGSQCPEMGEDSSGLCLGNLGLKYLPLVGATVFSTHTASASVSSNNAAIPENCVVCASTGLAGIGMLTDHGFKTHGQQLDDYKVVWNDGRGPLFWDFRGFVLNNVGISPHVPPPFKVTFSIHSSNNPSRRRDFFKQIKMVKSVIPSASVATVELATMTMPEQLKEVLETKVFVSVIGGSTSTAMFLQRNACLILFYNDMDDFASGTQAMPTMMDFDFWNNASYLQVHWLPISTMDSDKDLGLLASMIQEQLGSS